jgi:hypothetical protein
MRIVAQHHFSAPQALGGNARVGLKAHSEIRRSPARARTANDFIASAESNGGAAGPGQDLSALGDHADCWFEIDPGDWSVRLVCGFVKVFTA